jgi:hypothetical protein
MDGPHKGELLDDWQLAGQGQRLKPIAFLQNNNMYSERMPPVIIVSVSRGDVGAMTLRARDFTPTKTDRELGPGGAMAFLLSW